MLVRNEKSFIEYNQEIISLLFNKKLLADLIDAVTEIINIINISNDLDKIVDKLTDSESFALLNQLASISHYLDQIRKYVIYSFVQYVLDEELDYILISLISIRILTLLYQQDNDLYNTFAQFQNHDTCSFNVTYQPVTDKINQATYQILFDEENKNWQVMRYSPENQTGEYVDHYQVLDCMQTVFAHITPKTMNPFVRKALYAALQTCENEYQKNLQINIFHNQYYTYLKKIQQYSNSITSGLPAYKNINIIYKTCIKNANPNEKPELIAKLLLKDSLFELVNKFDLISSLANHADWKDVKQLLDKKSIRHALLQAEGDEFSFIESWQARQYISRIYFKYARQEQLAKLKGHELNKLAMGLSRDDFVKYLYRHKILFDYPRYCHEMGKIFEFYPEEFETILEMMIASGKIIDDIPIGESITTDEIQKEMLKHYVNLLFKHNGQWFHLIRHDEDYIYNHRVDLLCFAMKINLKKTISFMDSLAYKDGKGNKYLPITMNAEEISSRIAKSPGTASVLLNYANIFDTLKYESCTIEPYGKIRHFDYLSKILHNVSEHYVRKLLSSGILFPEIGMPHFHHLSDYGCFRGKNPGGSISSNFEILNKILSAPIFMKDL